MTYLKAKPTTKYCRKENKQTPQKEKDTQTYRRKKIGVILNGLRTQPQNLFYRHIKHTGE